jgi:hypothetical protein
MQKNLNKNRFVYHSPTFSIKVYESTSAEATFSKIMFFYGPEKKLEIEY